MTELLTIHTPRVRLSWSGPGTASETPTLVRAFRGRADVRTQTEHVWAEPRAALGLAVPEESVLAFVARCQTGEQVHVAHRDPSQVAGVVQAEGGQVLHGRIRVRDEAGFSTFVVSVGGRPEVEVTWPIVPTKVSAEDVTAMRSEAENVWTGVARSAWSATTEGAAPSASPSAPAWLDLLREATSRLAVALREIARRPEVDLARAPRTLTASRLRGDAASVKAIQKGRGRGGWHQLAGAHVQEKVAVGVLRSSQDVAAHRWIRGRIERALRRLAAVQREERAHHRAEHGRRRVLLKNLSSLGEQLRSLAQALPLAEVSGARTGIRAPLVLRTRPAYRQAFDALRLLENGLAVADGEIETAWMGTARLYETWAALAVVQEAASLVGVEPPRQPFGVDHWGARVRIRRGHRAAVRLAGEEGALSIAYEPTFRASPALLVQRPDLVLTLRQSGVPPRRAVLDAKYRREDSGSYVRQNGAPGPPEDALGDLHRYRDAIVGPDGERLVERAAALFPHRAARSFAASRVWTSHATVGVGAIPLVPGDRAWLRRWLADWLAG